MGFFSNLNKRNSLDRKFKDKILEATAKLNQVSELCPDFSTKLAVSNTVMIMKGAEDKFTNYTKGDLEEIFGFVDKLIGDISVAAAGISNFNGKQIQTNAFVKSVSAYVSLLAIYLSKNLVSGKKTFSEKEAEEHRRAISYRQNNEELELRAADYEKQIDLSINEKEEKQNRREEILEKVRSGECSKTEQERLEREYNSLTRSIDDIDRRINNDEAMLKHVRDTITDIDKYNEILKSADMLDKILATRPYDSVEEFARAVESYKEKEEKISMEHDAVTEIYSSTKSSVDNAKRDSAFENACKEGETNRKKRENKQQDEDNFSLKINSENEN